MILVVGQYHSSLLSALSAQEVEFEILKDAKRYSDPEAFDFGDEASLLDHVRSLQNVECAFAMYEQYVPIAAKINAAIGNRHTLGYESAMMCTDKVLMRDAFSRVSGISPAFAEVTSREQAIAFAQKHAFPLILKPANLSKSMLVSKCRDLAELEAVLAQTFQDAPALYAKYTLGQQPKFIIEEFMEGSIHTVAAFVDQHGDIVFANGIVDNVSAQEIGYNDGFIFSRSIPSQLSTAEQHDMYECAKKGIAALGMRSCPAHVEMIMTPHGARIIEIGARLGGYRPLMYKIACGYDLINAAIDSYRGTLPVFDESTAECCAVVELFPRQKGTFESVEPHDVIAGLPSLHSIKVAKKPGELIGRSAEGFKAAAFVTLAHKSNDQLQKDLSIIRDTFSVRVS